MSGSRERLPREVWVLVAVSFVIAVGFGLVAPVLPTYARSFDVSVTAASVVISAFAAMRLAFAPVSGRLIGAVGERPVYVWGITIVGLSTGACAFAASYWQLLVLRGLGGIGSTMFTVSALALLVRMSPPSMRGRASGLWATSFLLGNVTGPLVGGGLVAVSLRAPFLVYAAALFVAAAVAWLFLRRSALADPEAASDEPPMPVREALRSRAYRAALASSFASGWAVFGIRVSLVPLFVVEGLEQGPEVAGIALTVFAAGNVVVLTVSGRLSDRFGRRPLVLAGLVVSGTATGVLGLSASLPVFLAVSAVAGAGTALLTPAQGAAVADVVGAGRRGGPVLAAFQMASDVGAIIGPLAAGALADGVSYAAAFGVTGVVSLLAVALWARAPETLPRLTTPPAAAAERAVLDDGQDVPTGREIAPPSRT